MKWSGLGARPFQQKGVPCFDFVDANRLLLRCELNAALAWFVLDTRKKQENGERSLEAWRAGPDRARIAPAWYLEHSDDFWLLNYRPAVRLDLLPRAIRGLGA